MGRSNLYITLGIFLLTPLALLSDSSRVNTLRKDFQNPKTSTSDQIELAFMLAEQFRNYKEFDSTLFYAEKGMELSGLAGEDRRIQFYNLMGQIYFENKSLLLASRFFHQGAMLAKKANDPLKSAHLQNSLGIIHATFGAYERAEKAFEFALEIFKSQQNMKKQVLSTQKNLMQLYLFTGRENKALILGEQIYQKTLEGGFSRMACKIRLMEADHFLKVGSYSRARNSLEEGMAIANEEKLVELIEASLLAAQFHGQDGNLTLAENQLALAMSQVKKLHLPWRVAKVYETYGQVYGLSDDNSQALKAYQNAYAHLDSAHLQQRKEILEKMSILHRKMGDPFKADSLSLAAGILGEEFYEQRRKYRMDQLRKGADFDAKLYQWESRDHETRSQKQNTWLVFALFLGILFVLGWAYFLYRKKNPFVKTAHEQKKALGGQSQMLTSEGHQLEVLTAILSHDFKSPLRTILNQVHFLIKAKEAKERETYFENIQKTVLRLEELVNHLFTLTRVGKRDEPPVEVELNILIKGIIEDLSEMIHRSGGKVIADNLPSASLGGLPTLSGYQPEIRQLFQNLIENGLKFSRPGVAPIVKIFAEKLPSGYRIYVQDNGIGLNPDHLSEAIQPHRRIHDHPSLYPGTGMGLAICKKVCEVHGWELGVEAAEGGGARFWVGVDNIADL